MILLLILKGGGVVDIYEELSDRKLAILLSSVDEYIHKAMPITSGGIKVTLGSDISTATLRAELNAMSAMGFFKQLHTSGGRVPTSKAYRLYVNSIMKDLKFVHKDLEKIEGNFVKKANNLKYLLDSVANTISKVTNYPTVVVMDDLKKLIVQDIKIIPLIDLNALMLLETSSGVISNDFGISKAISNDDCINCARLLGEKFVGKSVGELIDSIEVFLTGEINKIDSYREILENVIDILKTASSPTHSGETKLLQLPEYSSVEKAQELISLIEDDEQLKRLIIAEGDEVSFTIGRENECEALKDCAVIKAPIKIGNTSIASVGVIGPERIDYALVAGAINYVLGELTNSKRISDEGDENGKKDKE